MYIIIIAQKCQVSTPMNEPQTCDSLIVESTLDIGYYINVHSTRDDLRLKLLTTPYVPPIDYDFKKDEDTAAKRGFSRTHLERYQWMVYSPIAKEVLCKYCVLFRPTLLRGSFGVFIKRGFKKFYQIHKEAKKYTKSRWHSESTAAAKFFHDIQTLKKKDVTEQINSASQNLLKKTT
jgi:hypothetical protein